MSLDVPGWRAVLAARPDDGEAALGLKRALREAGMWPDDDPAFRRAARALPDEAWLGHYAGLYQFHADDLPFIDARARGMLAARAGDARVHALIGDVARQRRDWAEAARSLGVAADLNADGDYAARAAVARQYAGLAGVVWPDTGPATLLTVVNLDRNPERLAEFSRQFAGVPWRRQRGVEGAALPGPAVAQLAGEAGALRGTLGCFLSHCAVWEGLLAGPDELAFVVEDDVIPLLALPARLGLVPFPAGWDVLWVNDRMEPRMEREGAGFQVVPVAEVLGKFAADDYACGTDGYLISRAGAAKLLAWVAEDGMAADVDWRMVAYGMGATEIAELPPGHAREVLTAMDAGNGRGARLAMYSLLPALIRTVGVGSDRDDGNRAA